MTTEHHAEPAPRATATQRAAAEIRGLMGARKLGPGALAGALDISAASAGRRLNGEIDLTLDEVEAIATWLDVPVTRIIAPAAGVAFAH